MISVSGRFASLPSPVVAPTGPLFSVKRLEIAESPTPFFPYYNRLAKWSHAE